MWGSGGKALREREIINLQTATYPLWEWACSRRRQVSQFTGA